MRHPLILAALLPLLDSGVAYGKPPFDAAKRAVLPSEAAASILKRHDADSDWTTSEWAISREQMDRLEIVLAAALRKAGFGRSPFETRNFYRQYIPVRWKTFHIIVVNGFRSSGSDLFPDQGIPPDQWKHGLVTAFGGGCWYWYTVYLVEENRLMVFPDDGSHHGDPVVCNAPK